MEEAHTAQCTASSTLLSLCRPSPRASRVPEPPSLTRPPRNFPGAQLVQRLSVLHHAALLRPQPGSAQLCPAAPCARCGVRAAGAAARLALRGSRGRGERAAGRSCGDVGAAAASLVCGGPCEKETPGREEGARRRGGTEEGGGQPGVAWESPEPASLKVGSPAPARTCTPEPACSSLHFIPRTSGVRRQLK